MTNLPDMPEAILRRIWQQQSFSQDHLRTRDGRAVRILSPGTPNTDGGPDFLGAKISIGRTTFHGDVELHINAEEWRSHKHDADPHYNKVILHVVLAAAELLPSDRTASQRPIPLLVLHPILDEILQRAWSQALLSDEVVPSRKLPCADVNENVASRTILDWLERLARERLELKLRRFEERLKQLVDETRHIVREPYPRYYGNPAEIPIPRNEHSRKDFADKGLWEQLLYEGIMEALGYSKNQQPFRDLARNVRLSFLRDHGFNNSQIPMAILFGAAGLLPSLRLIEEKESREYVAELRKIWKMIRPTYKGATFNEGDWLFFRLRPTNFPTARLAACCFLLPNLFGDGSFREIISLMKSESVTQKERLRKLHSRFAVTPDEFWCRHVHFKSKAKSVTAGKDTVPTASSAVALGPWRVHDILVNTFIPIILLYARIFNDKAVRRNARGLFVLLPASQENSTTNRIQRELTKEKVSLRTSLLQQGAIQLHRFFCTHSRCLECAIGRTIAEMPKAN